MMSVVPLAAGVLDFNEGVAPYATCGCAALGEKMALLAVGELWVWPHTGEICWCGQ